MILQNRRITIDNDIVLGKGNQIIYFLIGHLSPFPLLSAKMIFHPYLLYCQSSHPYILKIADCRVILI